VERAGNRLSVPLRGDLLAHFILLRKFPSGPLWVLFTLAAVFSGIRRFLRRPGLRPKKLLRHQPGKPWKAFAARRRFGGRRLLFRHYFSLKSLTPTPWFSPGVGVIGSLETLGIDPETNRSARIPGP